MGRGARRNRRLVLAWFIRAGYAPLRVVERPAARLPAMNAAVDDGRYIPPLPPGPPTQPHPFSSPGSAGTEHSVPLRRGPVSPSLLNTALPGFTPVHAQAPGSPYTFRSPVVAANPLTSLSPHGQVTTRHSPLSPNADSPSMAYRSASGSTMMDYNPQQWGRRGPIGGAYRPHTTLTVSAAPRQLDDSGRKSESILCQLFWLACGI